MLPLQRKGCPFFQLTLLLSIAVSTGQLFHHLAEINHTRLDLGIGQYDTISTRIAFGASISKHAVELCSEDKSLEQLKGASGRCCASFSHAIRTKTFSYVYDVYVNFYFTRLVPLARVADDTRDGLLFPLTYAYDPVDRISSHVHARITTNGDSGSGETVVLDQGAANRLCIIGDYRQHLAIMALLYFSEVIWAIPSDTISPEDISDYEALQSIASNEGKRFELLSYTYFLRDLSEGIVDGEADGQRRPIICDVLQFRGNAAEIYLHDVTHRVVIATLQDAAVRDQTIQQQPDGDSSHSINHNNNEQRPKNNFLRIIWERHSLVGSDIAAVEPQSQFLNDRDPLIHWEAFSVWPVGSRIEDRPDSEGFSSRAFSVDYTSSLYISETWIGRVDLVPSSIATAPAAAAPATMETQTSLQLQATTATTAATATTTTAAATAFFPAQVTSTTDKKTAGAVTTAVDTLSTSTITITTREGSINSRSRDNICIIKSKPLVIAITYTNRVFEDNAFGLQDALLRAGYEDVRVMGDFSLTQYHDIMTTDSGSDCSNSDNSNNRNDIGEEVGGGENQRPPCDISDNINGNKDTDTTHKDSGTANKGAVKFLQIALGPHEITMLTVPYIAFHMEQRWSIYITVPHFFAHYNAVLRGAAAVFVLSNFHRRYLIDLCDLKPEKVFVVPIYHTNAYTDDVYAKYRYHRLGASSQNNNTGSTDPTGSTGTKSTTTGTAGDAVSLSISKQSTEEDQQQQEQQQQHHEQQQQKEQHKEQEKQEQEQPYPSILRGNGELRFTSDVLFFGSSSPRRRRFAFAADRRVTATHGNAAAVDHSIKLHIRSVSWDLAIFGGERDMSVLRSKVVVNLHTEDGSSLEVHRINYLLSLGACVVSERSLADPQLDALYDGALVFVNNTRTQRIKPVKVEHLRGSTNAPPAIATTPGTMISTGIRDSTKFTRNLDIDPRTAGSTTPNSMDNMAAGSRESATGTLTAAEVDSEADDVEFKDIIDAAFQLARDPVRRRAIEERAKKKYTELSRDVTVLKKAMEDIDVNLRW